MSHLPGEAWRCGAIVVEAKALPAGAGCPGEDTWVYMGFGLCRGRCLTCPGA